ncbi:SSI family serine proteinase inhibitor [Streptomyces sp. NPDC088387]|uniref:SSI family serine proteinase inhibitor n=1 Tax=Streptomyces sp. NPDC088387 TaxID=3365859 RepID=UPI00382907B1
MTHTTYSSTARAVRGGLLAAALLAAATVPAQATAQPSLPGNWFYLTVTSGDAQSSDTRGTLLMCNPPQGHDRAAEACDQLGAVDGDIGSIPMDPAVLCPMIYAPVTAHASGQWNGRSVEYRQTFANECSMSGNTGAVFALEG